VPTAAKSDDRRNYRSERREQQAGETRRAVVDAALGLFIEKGWAATGMRDIAAAAGVAVETVYSHFSSKGGVLRAANDAAVAGDDAPIAVAERPEFVAMGQGSRPARIAAAARMLTDVHGRTAGMAKVLRQAAPTDDEIAEILRATRERQRLDVAAAFELIVSRAPTPVERDGIWAVTSPEVYLLLVDESGWTPEQFEAWAAETLERVVPRA
jgi:AcrR family transcriptional regulator